ncbi:MAG: acetyl xylan esterase [Sphingobacteriaceae bacterium]|nr:MAG: acetyl xylan esterase [Sphingobacteriaceae bacterium]
MKFYKFFTGLLSLHALLLTACAQELKYYTADNSNINYVGRIDFTDKTKPRFWAPGVYIQARFMGKSLAVDINDEELWGKNHNYLEVAIDNQTPVRLQTTGKTNHIVLADSLSEGIHTVTICKNTETNIGYLEFIGLSCEKLLPWEEKTKHKIEFIGNSITCGASADESGIPCGKGEWQDQHNAYMAYGPTTARMLNSQWHLTSYSGIGLIHSCCGIKFTMPEIFDRLNLGQDSLKWDFNRYTPDVVTVALGQNDGIQDSATFCGAYVQFIKTLRKHYQKADIVCLSSPMADEALIKALKNYITGVEAFMKKNGEKKLHHYFFKRRYASGCDTHPNVAEHQLIAAELVAYLKKLKGW